MMRVFLVLATLAHASAMFMHSDNKTVAAAAKKPAPVTNTTAAVKKVEKHLNNKTVAAAAKKPAPVTNTTVASVKKVLKLSNNKTVAAAANKSSPVTNTTVAVVKKVEKHLNNKTVAAAAKKSSPVANTTVAVVKKVAKLDINQKVYIEGQPVLGDGAGQGALNMCREFPDYMVNNPNAPSVKVCGTGVMITVYLRGACASYAPYEWTAGVCDTSYPASTCDSVSPADDARMGASQSYMITQC